jgi:2'-deoxynucleoside 5'-phosphate N-hydrolase
MTMNVYFGASIRGGRDHVSVYTSIQKLLACYRHVLTEHIGDSSLTSYGECDKSDIAIFKRDVAWIDMSDIVVLEVTNPSLGVGWEAAYAQLQGKKIVCLFNQHLAKGKLSAMIAGNEGVNLLRYQDIQEVAAFFNLSFR